MTKTTHIVAVLSLLFAVVCSATMVWVLYTITTSGALLQEHVTVISNHDAKEKAFSALSDLIKNTENERSLLKTFILTEEQTSTFLTDLEKIAQAQGVVLTTNSLDVTRQSGLFDILTIKFAIEGQDSNVQRMSTILETLPYHSQVVALTFSKTDGAITKGTIDLKVTLRKYE